MQNPEERIIRIPGQGIVLEDKIYLPNILADAVLESDDILDVAPQPGGKRASVYINFKHPAMEGVSGNKLAEAVVARKALIREHILQWHEGPPLALYEYLEEEKRIEREIAERVLRKQEEG